MLLVVRRCLVSVVRCCLLFAGCRLFVCGLLLFVGYGGLLLLLVPLFAARRVLFAVAY